MLSWGVNGFYDSSRLDNRWYPSGGVGLEMAANVAGEDAIDLTVNWYGNLFNRDVLVNAFRNQGNSFDVQAGYSHALFEHALDLRLKLTGYRFDIGDTVQGWRGGADLTTRNGMFTLRYERGYDKLNGDYHTVGGFVTMGFQLENLLSYENPITLPEPVFKSPRNLRRLLGLKVKRHWHQPAAVIIARSIRNQTLPCSDSLPGSVLASTSIEIDTDYVGAPPLSSPIPTITSFGATFCWCGLLSDHPAQIDLVVYDGTDTYFYAPDFLMTAPSGCIDLTVNDMGGGVSVSGFHLRSMDTTPLSFESGGGVSVLVNQ